GKRGDERAAARSLARTVSGTGLVRGEREALKQAFKQARTAERRDRVVVGGLRVGARLRRRVFGDRDRENVSDLVGPAVAVKRCGTRGAASRERFVCRFGWKQRIALSGQQRQAQQDQRRDELSCGSVPVELKAGFHS